jgi:hypothetical protein
VSLKEIEVACLSFLGNTLAKELVAKSSLVSSTLFIDMVGFMVENKKKLKFSSLIFYVTVIQV